MKLLVIGGSNFVGRHIVETAIGKGHEVTTFNRGKGNPGLFPNIEKIFGDRNDDLELLVGREWDAVIDTCGFLPSVVKKSVETLKSSVKHYTFISTISVYKDSSRPNIKEDAELAKFDAPIKEEKSNETYGPFKAICEAEVREGFKENHLIVRPGFIVGPYDYSDRFTYWISRAGRGGDILAPGNPNNKIQLIDARDLAEWVILSIERNLVGTYNVTGHQNKYTFGDMLGESIKLNENSRLVWAADEKLEGKVQPFLELPFWLPNALNNEGIFSVNIDKALAEGLSIRPLSETIKDTHDWIKAANHQVKKAGMSQEKETMILQELS